MTTLLLSALLALPATPVAVAGTGTGTDPASLERALDAIDAGRIKSDLYFIASDQLEGRDTPSSGLRIAARYIRARLERLGFTPGGPEGFLYVYHLQQKQIDEEGTRAAFVTDDGDRVPLDWGTDWVFSSRGLAHRDHTGPLVWMGEGAAEAFEGLELEGRVALLARREGVPWWAGYRRAKRAGAAAVLWTPEPGAPDPDADSWGEQVESCRAGRLGWPSDPDAPNEFTSSRLSAAAAARLFELAGHAGATPPVGTELPVSFHDVRSVSPDSPRVPVENVCGLWPGSDPVLAKEVVLVTAHYDHVGRDRRGIYNGADDNGSGTCGLLALAEALAEHGPLRRSVMLMWVSGEEKGLLGSKAWSLDPWLPDGHRAVCDVNIDMVGRNAPDSLLVTPSAEHEKYNGLTRLAQALAPLEGFGELGSADEYYHRSDHASFEENMGIPICFLFSDVHEDYHRPTDTADKVDYDKVRRATRLVLRMIAGLQEDDLGVALPAPEDAVEPVELGEPVEAAETPEAPEPRQE